MIATPCPSPFGTNSYDECCLSPPPLHMLGNRQELFVFGNPSSPSSSYSSSDDDDDDNSESCGRCTNKRIFIPPLHKMDGPSPISVATSYGTTAPQKAVPQYPPLPRFRLAARSHHHHHRRRQEYDHRPPPATAATVPFIPSMDELEEGLPTLLQEPSSNIPSGAGVSLPRRKRLRPRQTTSPTTTTCWHFSGLTNDDRCRTVVHANDNRWNEIPSFPSL